METFLAVARLSSFSRAAEKRFRTQPAISAQIRALEEEVSAKLLDRSGGKVSVTSAGKIFFKFAEDVLHVLLDGLDADVQRAPNLPVGKTESDVTHYLDLTVG